ncbi:MAG: YraN family protein [Piscirickettsiaceae bacterium]|nr:MAG: YraN family protein [Piscirickettsiaceae bacterium]PCI70814.1 MAG: YraN family protein [Piscirickettsiaceae bacterium]
MGLFKNTKTLGQQSEDLALAFLKNKGLTLIQRNYRSRHGEIDLIMQHEEYLVFVEVRYRSSSQFGGALSSVDHKKQSKLIKCAQHYLLKKPSKRACRFDVVAISPSTSQHEIQWITNAFDEF